MPQGIVGEFLSLKEETDADLLAMQCGDFYEFFADDAETVGRELDLKVSKKSSHGSSYPMAGVPLDDLTPYLKALVERGYRVAVADQYETAGGHAREVTRVVTPGTMLETSREDAQYLASVVREGDRYGLAFADVTTGQFLVTTVDDPDAAGSEVYRLDPVELLPGPDVRNDDAFLRRVRDREVKLTAFETAAFAPGRARHALREQFGDVATSAGLDDEVAIRAAGAVLAYVTETNTGVAASMTRLRTYEPSDHLTLDATTQRNLELTETMHGDRTGSLVDVIDHTVTSAGGRLLREWVTRPRRDRAEIGRRLDCVEALATEALARERLRDALDGAYDLERLASRAAGERADASDLLSIRDTLALVPTLAEAVEGSALADSPLAAVVARPDRDGAAALHAELDGALADDPPKTVTQGGLLRRGYDDDLDDLIERHTAVESWLDDLAAREKREHGLSHVTVDRNRTDGYYIQVGKSVADEVPEGYREIKTLKNSKRFVTDELEEREREILRIEEARAELEYELFCDLRERVGARAELLQDVGRTLAEVDALASLATHAAGNDWTRPTLTEPGGLDIEAGRHPVVERTTEFVPNDLSMGADRRFLIVTGPNMSGKSTYMRQAALITLLAQIGSFVPARRAEVGVVDGIYTRVGALDELAQGRSTFMVEMQELSNILHSATEESLVVLDEVGRGTATYDGISIAWAATEYLHQGDNVLVDGSGGGPKTLFATHYHELTELGERLPRAANVHMAGEENDGEVTFLRTVEEGPADRSYGIYVAELAGVPEPVTRRAREVLELLQQEKAIDVRGGSKGTEQVVFDLGSGQFATGGGSEAVMETVATEEAASDGGGLDPELEAVLDELRGIDVNDTSPLELMGKVQEWQRRLDTE
ncbi:DNA mismatch repair protein MutS [Salinigranum marinum]|uniref:DNA mismatch repair protein MutS n=1 Tax=Salinigranum marinum TaxID=1515595 RepID=UPI002989CDCE|nr:DNA mismatch repair protein MutS [Salinigranum marinum]